VRSLFLERDWSL
jgi:hypothetical protein